MEMKPSGRWPLWQRQAARANQRLRGLSRSPAVALLLQTRGLRSGSQWIADAGEILASRTVRDLVIGSERTFSDRGEHELKGIPDRWALYAVT